MRIDEGAPPQRTSTLSFNGRVFEPYTDVILTSHITQEDFLGSIISISPLNNAKQNPSPAKLVVKCIDGMKIDVLLEHLREGRCSIRYSDARYY